MKAQSVRFNRHKKSDFLTDLKKRLETHFSEAHSTQYANGAMYFKIAFWMIAWVATYSLMMYNFSGWATFLFALLHGFTHLFIAFNISHDANHGAISKNEKVNKFLSYTLDLIGVNSYLWNYSHNVAHHSYVNLEGVDTSIQGYGIIRFSSESPWKPIFRYQHIYAVIIYALATLNYVTIKDFSIFLHMQRYYKQKPPVSEWIKMFLFKAFYYTYVFVIPIVFLPYSLGMILLTFVIAHAFVGFMLALTFQTGHLVEETSFPEIDADGNVDKNWAIHIVETTGDYAYNNPIINWMFGGINIHVIHHLLPRICHIHYTEVAPIVEETAKEYGLNYRKIPTFSEAVASHFRLLKELGTKP